MVVAYTEVMDDFLAWSVGGGWDDYDIFTEHDIPKGAVVEIVLANSNPAQARIVGVREDGSGLGRTLELHEAEDGGFVTARFLTTVDAGTGLIEVYTHTDGSVTCYVVGYWTGIAFTEAW
ncbi:unnamed protein product, partial [marine sediment metagenome]